ncbi:MAG TPA: histidine phosphotransferase family protein [Nordella sp.]|nr:histidine phosphotransferase family protein [Nordella sp.]
MQPSLLSDLDLAALLCSRVCHDVISPVGAITNGLELLEVEDDEAMRVMAMDLVRKSARQASAKLKFCRIAFGAAGSAGSIIDMGEAGDVAKAFVGEEKIKLDWQVPRENRPKQQVKLLLNMMMIAMGCIPRGGVVKAEAVEGGFTVRATGEGAKIFEKTDQVLKGAVQLEEIDARLIQPYYARRLAEAAGLPLMLVLDGADVVVRAVAVAEEAAPIAQAG